MPASTAPAVIEFDRVTRFYGSRPGVLELSMRIEPGAFVGLLGPNGSGKTTTLRILACTIPPTSGTARVCGLDVFTESVEVRRRLGYLPENCPLYPEMRVIEYLRWTAGMKGLVGSAADRAVFEAMDACDLEDVRRQRISTLSKGYRQRVGLASVLAHRPEVLVLDEPTVGLDPLQVREFRARTAELKGRCTLVISSHILSEIEMLCDSVIILNEGWVVASGSPDGLRAEVAHRYRVECDSHSSLPILLPRLINRLPGLTLGTYDERDGSACFELRGRGPDPRSEIAALLMEAGIGVRELHRERVTLEDVFVHHTLHATAGPASGREAAAARTAGGS